MPKKGKVFAARSTMLSIIDQVNGVQDEKIRQLQEKDLELLKRMAQREASQRQRKESKGERLREAKERLKQGKGAKLHKNEQDDSESNKKKKGMQGGARLQGKPGKASKGNHKHTSLKENGSDGKKDRKSKSVSFK